MTTAFKIHPDDNVATLLTDAALGEQVHVRGETRDAISVAEAIGLGHKVALATIATGAPIIKFGIPIGTASRTIAAGQWVHLHNCASGFDERSGAFDLETGAAKDIVYA